MTAGDDQSARTQLEQVREDYESLFNSLSDAVFIREVGGTFQRVNQTAIDRLGYAEAELLSMTPEDITWDYDETEGETQIHREEHVVFENVHVTKDGETYPVEVSATAISYRGSDAILSVARDISQRKEYETKLEEERRQYSTLVEQSHDGIAITQDGVYAFVNPRMETLTGRSEKELLGLPFYEIFTPEYQEIVKERYEQRIAGEQPTQRYDVEIRTPDGEDRYVDLQVSRITYDGEPAILGTFKDITKRKEYETGLERQNRRLDKFASMITHDLRNPLGIAQTYVDFAEETGDPDDFQAIRDGLDRMEAMIDDLLTMARTDPTVEDPEPVDLGALASEAWQTVQTETATLDIAAPDGWTVPGDYDKLLHVFENLFQNSVEHADGSVTIRVGTLHHGDGFYIEDTGPGIPDAEREAVFEHGYTTEDDGTGIGLAIVADIIRAHGWEIEIGESADGGARFEIRTAQRQNY